MKPVSSKWRLFVWKSLNYTPNEAQSVITDWWFNGDDRFALICGGERAGKSLTSAAMMLPLMMVPLGVFWIVGPDYAQARVEFQYIHDAFTRGGLLQGEPSMPQSGSQPWTLTTKWNATLTTRTSSDIAKLSSFRVHGFLMVEAAQQLYEVWLKLSGRVAETRGFGILSGTLEQGLPWYADMLKRWKAANDEGGKSFSLSTWSNVDIFPGGRDDPEIKRLEATYPEDLFLERFGAEPRTLHGVVLPEFDFEKHVRELELVEDAPVELWIDPGTNCYCVLFVQYIKPCIYVLDRIYEREAIDHDVIEQAKAHPLFSHVKGGVIDIAGKHQNQGARSQVQLWQELAGVALTYRYIFENDSIEVLRKHLANGWLVFNSCMTNKRAPDSTALDVLAEPELWRWPNRSFRQNEAARPIDANNHAMKAIAYGAIEKTGFTLLKKKEQGRVIRPSFWTKIDETRRARHPT